MSDKHSLRLELLCGSTEVGAEHPGHWAGMGDEEDSDAMHPKHAEILNLLGETSGVFVSVSSHREPDADYSDAYIYCEPEHLSMIADTLREIKFEGDILDVLRPLAPDDRSLVNGIGGDNNWKINERI